MSSFLDCMKKSFLIAVLDEIGVYGDKHSISILFIIYNNNVIFLDVYNEKSGSYTPHQHLYYLHKLM